MSKASRRWKERARRWNRENQARRDYIAINPRKEGSLASYRAHRRRIQMYGEDIFASFF